MENKNTQDFETALAAFIANSQEKVNVYFKTNYPRLAVPTLIVMPGVKNVRIVRNEEVSRSAWAFIDKSTGDILKAASWKVPAKHSRGNIYQPESWVTVTSHGPAYLK
jgi:hypothetical protein